jgi:SAM-dependent methyltransferase
MTSHSTFPTFIRASARRLLRWLGGRQGVDYRRWYARWDLQRDYWTIVGPATKEEYERLSRLKLQHLLDLGLTPDARVLDVGCGTGLLTAALEGFLSERGLYHGSDLSPEAVAFCRSRFLRPNFHFQTNEMTVLPRTDILFDFIVFYSVFTHTFLEETVALLKESRRLLAPGGILFADLFLSDDVELQAGDRGAVEINRRHFLSRVEECGLRADLVMVHPWRASSERMFFKFSLR